MAENVQLPSVQLDLVREDLGDATQGSVLSGNAEPFTLADGETLDVAIDGGAPTTITFNAVDFINISAATAAEVADIINTALTGSATTVEEGGAIRITSDAFGLASSVEITGGTAAAAFAFPGGAHAGSDATNEARLINRIPEPDEVGVPVGSDVEIEIHDPAGAPAVAGVEVAIEGTLAYDGDAGGFQAGFTGTVSNPDAQTLRIVIDPDTDFPDDTEINVDVDAVGGSTPIAESYKFNTEDLTSPRVLSAIALDHKRVRVTFSEPVVQTSTSGSNDALNPAHYAFAALSVPAVSVEAVEVEPVSSSEVDVTLDIELSIGAEYRVTVTLVEDLYGNVVSAPNNTATFDGYACPVPTGRRFELIEFLPQLNRSEDATEHLLKYILINQDVVNLLLCEIDRFATIIDPDRAPEPFLSAMLDDLGNPFAFVGELEEIDKRRLLRVLIDIYKLKGTARGIIDVINFFLGIVVTIDVFNGEGWELADSAAPTLDGQSPPSGPGDELSSASTVPADAASLGPGTRYDLYSFVVISPVTLTTAQRDQIEAIVDLMKPAHTHLVRIEEPTTAPVPLGGDELGGGELSSSSAVGTPPWILS